MSCISQEWTRCEDPYLNSSRTQHLVAEAGKTKQVQNYSGLYSKTMSQINMIEGKCQESQLDKRKENQIECYKLIRCYTEIIVLFNYKITESQTWNACMSIVMDASDTDFILSKCDVQFIQFSMLCQKNKCLSNSSIWNCLLAYYV